MNLNIKDIKDKRAITITFWYKYWGIFKANDNDCPTVFKVNRDLDARLCIDKKTFEAKFFINLSPTDKKLIFSDFTMKERQGFWNLISIANLNSEIGGIQNYFENTTNLFFFNTDTSRQKDYFIPSPGFPINILQFGFEVVALFGEVRIYNSYITNPLGWVTNQTTKNQYLYIFYPFKGKDNTSCIKTEEADDNDITLNCVEDYNKYLDPDNECKELNTFLDVSDPKTTKCSSKTKK